MVHCCKLPRLGYSRLHELIPKPREQVDILSVRQTRRFDSLDRETILIVEALLEDRRANIARDIREEIAGLAQLFNRRDAVVTETGTEHRIIVDAFENRGPVTEEHERQREKEKRLRESIDRSILESLDFTAMTERFEVVHEAHVRTFQWIFEPNPGDCEWEIFAEWLVHSDGLYWIH